MKSRFIRFLAVGGLNTAFGYAIFALLSWLGLPYPIAIALATIIGVAFNYQSIRRLVFSDADSSRIWKFGLVYLFLYGVNVLLTGQMLRLGLSVYLANALLLVPIALMSFILQRKFVFSTSAKT